MAEWVSRKGFPPVKDFSQGVPVSRYHTRCLASDGTGSKSKATTHPVKPPTSNPWTVFSGLPPPDGPPSAPDLRGSVVIRERGGGQLEYVTEWDGAPRRLPDLPADVLKRVLFPKAFPSRITSPRHFGPRGVAEVRRCGRPPGRTTSPWTEVAMHLAEVLEPGHY